MMAATDIAFAGSLLTLLFLAAPGIVPLDVALVGIRATGDQMDVLRGPP